MSRLIINGLDFELQPSKPIARTLQVNDIATLNNRQANFTPTISIPRTATNIKNFAYLGIIGNSSGVPYQRNECYYYAESGECLIYNGWAVINATSKEFKVNLYDGNIDLYKAIENETLNVLPLDEINHVKTLENVVDSINGLTEYKYILADYNGKALYDTNKINIDYLVPSVSVSYLWNKIFEYYGFTYSGSVFSTFAFQNLYMTFPKGIGSTIPDTEYFSSSSALFYESGIRRAKYFYFDTNTLSEGTTIDANKIRIKTNNLGIYRIEINGDLSFSSFASNQNFIIGYALNTELINLADDISSFVVLGSYTGTLNQSININSLIEITDVNDSISFFVRLETGGIFDMTNSLTFTISKVESQTIDFSGAFLYFKTKDFLNEVLTRFGLTPYKDKYTNNYRFLTLYELLQNTDVVDWSSKFHDITNESYTYGSYAQKNDLTYKYNDTESEYYNGSILVENVNLPDSKSVINSRIYAPEKTKSNVLPKETNVYKLWDKEVKDDGTVTYKSLDKRFYFMRADNYIFDSAVTIGSETLASETTIGQAPYESFYKLPFNDIVQDFYLPIYQILNKACLCELSIFLNDTDIANIDFSKLYWIEQLNSYFILNKISNYTNKGITKCEMIKVDYVPQITESVPTPFTISWSADVLYFSGYDESFPIIIQTSTDGGLSFSNASTPISSNAPYDFPVIVTELFVRCIDLSGNVVSNILRIRP